MMEIRSSSAKQKQSKVRMINKQYMSTEKSDGYQKLEESSFPLPWKNVCLGLIWFLMKE